MTLTISFFVIVMMMLASISASSAENGPLTERLHALNPVLKDHRIVYSDPLSPSSYASQAIFNPRGMHHVYTITHTFLDLILRKEVLPKSLNATVIVKTIENNPGDLPKVLGNHWEELLLQYIGVITASICGLLLALAIPFAGFCLCCCRCAGKCGAYPQHFDKRRDACKRSLLGVILSVFVIAAMFGVVTAFVTSQYAHEGVMTLPEKIQGAADDTNVYLKSTEREVKVLLEDNFDELSEGLDKILDGSGHILKDNLAQVTQAVAIDNLATIVSGLGNVKRHLKDIERETTKVQIKVDQLRDGLGETKVKLVTALNQCATNEACSTFMQEYDIDKDLAVASDFKNLPSELPNVGPLLKDIADLMNNDIERKVKGGKKQLEKVKNDIEKSMTHLRPQIKNEIKNIGKMLKQKSREIQNVLNETENAISEANRHIPKARPILDEYGIYVYYIGLGMSLLVLLVLTCHILGLFYGFCGKRPGNVYGDDCCNRGSGANWLLAGVYLTFLFSLVLLAMTTALFLVGAITEKVACQALQHPDDSEIFQVLDQKFIQPLIQESYPRNVPLEAIKDISLRHMISRCHHNETLYNLLNLKTVYDVDDLKNWRTEYQVDTTISSLKNKIRLDDDLEGIEILSSQAEAELVQLAESQISDLNLGQYTKLMEEQITNLDLEMFIQKLKRVNQRLQTSPEGRLAVVPTINNQILFLDQMQRVVKELETSMRSLESSVQQLEQDAKFNKVDMREALRTLIKQASQASKFLREEGPELIEKLANSYVNETIGQIDDYAFRVVNYTKNFVGRCQPLSNSYNATVIAVCNQIVDPFNGFWASIGWCYLFYLPSIALAIALVSLYKKSEPYPGPLVEVQPEDVGPPAGSKKKNRRGHRRNASEYLPDSAHYRAGGYSYQDRESRFQDTAQRNYEQNSSSSAPPMQPAGGPPRYTSNPNLVAEVNPEYERPPPYYYPGAPPASAT